MIFKRHSFLSPLVDSSSSLPITTVGVAAAAVGIQSSSHTFVPSIFHSFSSVGALQVVGCKMKPYVTIRQLISDLVMWKDISQEFNFRVFEENRFELRFLRGLREVTRNEREDLILRIHRMKGE
ncbi:hypothetical protein P8452_64228 [Trifolium repens]|nr:hypothetical protein P8452_64228 [Trifolium repens]